MKRLILIIPLLVGIANAKDLNKSVTITEAGIKYALNKNYAQLMKYSVLSDNCFRAISEGKTDDLEKCESYQMIVKDIKTRIEDLEDLKRRYYSKK